VVGNEQGVLAVVVRLPMIENHRIDGVPEVLLANLDGINEATRKEYQHRPMSTLSIPRQVLAKVDGDMADFTLAVDERGHILANMTLEQSEWIRARAAVGQTDPTSRGDAADAQFGAILLLSEITLDDIGAGFGK
jgi:hypothetical protein